MSVQKGNPETAITQQQLVDAVGHPICAFDTEEKIVFCNAAFEMTLGVRGIVGERLATLFDKTEFKPIAKAVRACLAGTEQLEETIQVDGFPIRHFQIVARPVFQRGQVNIAVCTLADISDRIVAQDIAERARVYYQQILEDLPQAYLQIADDLTILRANTAAAKLFRIRQQDMAGSPVTDFIFSADGASLSGKTSGCSILEAQTGTEYSGLCSDNTRIPIRYNVIPVEVLGTKVYSIVILDLTEDRAREKSRMEHEKRAQDIMMAEALGDLAGNLAHDLNNILAIISGYSEIIGLDATEAQRPAVDEILNAVRRASSLTSRTLAYTGRQQIQKSPLELSSFLSDAFPVLQDSLGEMVKISFFSEESGCWLDADKRQIMQVVFNLLQNSREAMGGEGAVTLSVSTSNLDKAFLSSHAVRGKPGKYRVIRIRDSGPGIPPGILIRIFEPYFSTKDRQKSSGLGLAIAQGILKQHGGFILCEDSQPGKTTMGLYFPASDPPVQSSHAEFSGLEINPADHLVLVVDDEAAIVDMVASALLKTGFSVQTATSGKGALDWIENSGKKPNLLISDVMMPKMSGLELVHNVLMDYPQIPIIFMTGYSSQNIDKNPALRNFKLVQKPFSPLELATLARREIARAVSSNQEFS